MTPLQQVISDNESEFEKDLHYHIAFLSDLVKKNILKDFNIYQLRLIKEVKKILRERQYPATQDIAVIADIISDLEEVK